MCSEFRVLNFVESVWREDYTPLARARSPKWDEVRMGERFRVINFVEL